MFSCWLLSSIFFCYIFSSSLFYSSSSLIWYFHFQLISQTQQSVSCFSPFLQLLLFILLQLSNFLLQDLSWSFLYFLLLLDILSFHVIWIKFPLIVFQCFHFHLLHHTRKLTFVIFHIYAVSSSFLHHFHSFPFSDYFSHKSTRPFTKRIACSVMFFPSHYFLWNKALIMKYFALFGNVEIPRPKCVSMKGGSD